MKKCVLLFVILIAVLTLTLVAFSCESERVGQTAEADSIFYFSSGVVKENYITSDPIGPLFVETSASSVDSLSSSTLPGFYYYKSSSNFSMNVGVDGSVTFLRAKLYFVFDIPSNGYYYFTLSVFNHDANQSFAPSICILSEVPHTVKNLQTWVASSNSYSFFSSFSGSDYYTSGQRVAFYYNVTSYSSTFQYVKLEKYDSSVSDRYHSFTGFAVPGVTFDPNDYNDPSPYDEWNGIVHPNLLTQTDFYRYPFYHSGSYNIPTNVYYSDLPTSSFSGYPEDNHYVFEMHVAPDPEMGDVMPPTASIKYRYINNEPLTEYWNSIFTLSGAAITSSISSGSIILHDDLGRTASKALSFDSFSFMESVLFEYQDYEYLDIEISFVGVPGQTLDVFLNYGKLEVGDLFTGFVPDEHSSVGPINYNLLPNYDFADVPFVNAPVENNADNWVIQHVAPNGDDNLTILRSTSGALNVNLDYVDTLLNSNTVSLVYDYVPADTLPDNNFTFSLYGISYSGIEINCYSLPYTSEALPYARFYFARSLSEFNMSVVFPAYSSGVRIELRMTVQDVVVPFSSTSFVYAKLEYGTRFTGFVGEYDGAYNDGYDQGYTAGYSDGIDQFASSSYKLVFDNTGSNLSLATGWADMGLSSAAEIPNIVWSITPAYYEELNTPVISSGYFYLRNNDEINGVRVYCSKYELNEELYDEYFNIYWVDIYEHSSTLVARDDTFPETWLSDALYRTVSVNVARYNTDIYNKIYDNAYQKGWYAGEDEGIAKGREHGYNNGKAVGYQDGLKTAQNGSWTGLVSALIDVPVTTIVSFLDFDILGFNMLSALKTIILLSLFFFVIRFVTAKVL